MGEIEEEGRKRSQGERKHKDRKSMVGKRRTGGREGREENNMWRKNTRKGKEEKNETKR